MPDSSLDFASLLCSRLCHDLLSPVSAMGNGMELLADEDDPAMRGKIVELLADSARASADRLKFFRLAFGAGGALGDMLDASEVKIAIDGLVRGNPKIELGWHVPAGGVAKSLAKILLNLAMIGFDSLVRGGRLDLGAEGGEVVVRAEGARLVLDQEVRAVLSRAAAPVTARTSVAWLARKLAEERGGTVTLSDQGDGVLLLAAHLPA